MAASGELQPKDLSDAAAEGDVIAIELLAEAGKYLGIAMATVASLLDIRLFIVSGGVAQAGNFLLEPGAQSIARSCARASTRLGRDQNGKARYQSRCDRCGTAYQISV